jgi:hypothetical protein
VQERQQVDAAAVTAREGKSAVRPEGHAWRRQRKCLPAGSAPGRPAP